MFIVTMTRKQEIKLGKEIRKKYGATFMVYERQEEIILKPIPKEKMRVQQDNEKVTLEEQIEWRERAREKDVQETEIR